MWNFILDFIGFHRYDVYRDGTPTLFLRDLSKAEAEDCVAEFLKISPDSVMEIRRISS